MAQNWCPLNLNMVMLQWSISHKNWFEGGFQGIELKDFEDEDNIPNDDEYVGHTDLINIR